MRSTALSAALVLVLSGCAAGPDPRVARMLRPAANPSAVISTELAFARAAREKGTWTAFRAYAAKDAIWPGPQWESVQAALKGQADPQQAIVWEPDMVWSSCDGSYALSTGPATHPGGRKSRFATIWQRQDNGEYRWVLDQGFDIDDSYAAPEMIAAKVADCPKDRAQRAASAQRGTAWQSGTSDDRSLVWKTELHADCSRTLTVSTLQDGAMVEAFRRISGKPPVATGAAAPTC
jgi:hypothetical protein